MAPESDGPPDVPDGGESVASGLAQAASRAEVLDQDDDGKDDDDDEEDAPDDPDGTGPGGSLAVLAEGAAAKTRVEKKDAHPPGVWGDRSCTGYKLAVERVAKMDHTDGKGWEVEVWNIIEDPGGGNDLVNFQSVPRYYEQKTRAMITVPYMGKM